MKILVPLGDWVLVNLLKESQTVGGIIIPDSASPERAENIVEAIGEKITKVKVGDSVAFIMQTAIKVDLPNVEKGRVLIKEENILGRIVNASQDN